MSEDSSTTVSDRPLLAGLAILAVATVVWVVASFSLDGDVDAVQAVAFGLVFAVVYVGVTLVRGRWSH